MKVNRTQSIINKRMRAKGDTRDRPEERLAYNIIKAYLLGLEDIDNQVLVRFNERNHAVLDIAFTANGKKYAVRLQGPPHGRRKAKLHDNLQWHYLDERAYTVIDFPHDKMHYLFLRNKRKLTLYETLRVYFEIQRKLFNFYLYLKPPQLNISDLQD